MRSHITVQKYHIKIAAVFIIEQHLSNVNYITKSRRTKNKVKKFIGALWELAKGIDKP